MEHAGEGSARGERPKFRQRFRLLVPAYSLTNNPGYGEGKKGPWLERTTPVGSYRPAAWGLYDMHGKLRVAKLTFSISSPTTVL